MKKLLLVALFASVSVVIIGGTVLQSNQHTSALDNRVRKPARQSQPDYSEPFDVGRAVLILTPLLILGGAIGLGVILVKRAAVKHVVLPVLQAKQEVTQTVTDWNKARIERYNNLPDLGKARADKRSAEIAKYGGTAAYGLAATIVFSCAGVFGAWLIPLAFGGRWVAKNWKEQGRAIKEADERREKILGPSAVLSRSCTHCRMSMAENSRFCTNCGLAVTASTRSEEAVVDATKLNDEWAEAVSHWAAPETKQPFSDN
jgi:hypothetical protein